MKTRYVVTLFAIAFFIQTTLVNIFSIAGTGPNLMLSLLLVLLYLYKECALNLLAGTVAAFLYDICFCQYLGVSTLVTLLTGLIAIAVRKVLNGEKILAAAIIIAGGTLLYNLIFWCVMVIGGHGCAFMHMIVYQPAYILYNIVFGGLIYIGLNKWNKRKRRSRYYL